MAGSHELWWGYLCQAMADIGPLKDAQVKLMALGVRHDDAGVILSGIQKAYTDSIFEAAARYERDNQ